MLVGNDGMLKQSAGIIQPLPFTKLLVKDNSCKSEPIWETLVIPIIQQNPIYIFN